MTYPSTIKRFPLRLSDVVAALHWAGFLRNVFLLHEGDKHRDRQTKTTCLDHASNTWTMTVGKMVFPIDFFVPFRCPPSPKAQQL